VTLRSAVAPLALAVLAVIGAQASLLSQRLLLEVRLPVLLAGVLASSPGWLILVFAARGRGAAGRWLAVAAAWGALVAPWLSIVMETIAGNLADSAPATAAGAIVAPLVEEPLKGIGVLISLAGMRRSGTAVGAALGAAVGGLAGLAFGVVEASHHVGAFAGELGYVDLSGVFVLDMDAVWHLAEIQLVQTEFFFGLTNHALFSALAGVGIAPDEIDADAPPRAPEVDERRQVVHFDHAAGHS